MIDYRTFGILLLNETKASSRSSSPCSTARRCEVPRVPLGEGLVGYAALHREPVLVSDVSQDPRYIKRRARRALGAGDPAAAQGSLHRRRRSREPRARRVHQARRRDPDAARQPGGGRDRERAALRGSLRANEARLEKEVRFAQRVQMALLPTGPPKRLKGVEVAAAFAPARELGGDFHDYLAPESNTLVVAVGDVSGKGVPAALYSAFAAELVRGRTFRRRYLPGALEPGERALVDQHDPAPAAARGVLLHALLRDLRSEAAHDDDGELGLPYPVPLLGRRVRRSSCRACRSGRSRDRPTTKSRSRCTPGDVFVFCTDGVFEAMNEHGQEFTAARLLDVVSGTARELPPRRVVDAIFRRCRVARRRAAQRRHDGRGGGQDRGTWTA